MPVRNETQQLLIANFLQPADIGGVYRGNLPQHITLLHWFVGNPHLAIQAVNKIASTERFIESTVGEPDLFGYNQDVPVYRIEPKLAVVGLHKALLAEIYRQPGTYHPDPQWTGDGYNPHLTIHGNHPPVTGGQELMIDNLTLVTRSQESTGKRIIYFAKLAYE